MKVEDGEAWSLASEMTSFDCTIFPRCAVEEGDFNDNVYGYATNAREAEILWKSTLSVVCGC